MLHVAPPPPPEEAALSGDPRGSFCLMVSPPGAPPRPPSPQIRPARATCLISRSPGRGERGTRASACTPGNLSAGSVQHETHALSPSHSTPVARAHTRTHTHTQLEGVSPEEHRRLVRELAAAQRSGASLELELRAALDKLEVHRRWRDDAAAAAGAWVGGGGGRGGPVMLMLLASLQAPRAADGVCVCLLCVCAPAPRLAVLRPRSSTRRCCQRRRPPRPRGTGSRRGRAR
jgi:hypothetical protein